MKNEYFLDKLYLIINDLSNEEHQKFTLSYMDNLLIYFESNQNSLTFDDLEFKM